MNWKLFLCTLILFFVLVASSELKFGPCTDNEDYLEGKNKQRLTS